MSARARGRAAGAGARAGARARAGAGAGAGAGAAADVPRGRLPAGGGGAGAHLFGECRAALAGGAARAAGAPPLALPPLYRARADGADAEAPIRVWEYPRIAIVAAFAELAREEPALRDLRPRAFLSTSTFPDMETDAFPWAPNFTDVCDYGVSGAACDMHAWARGGAPLAHAPYDLVLFSQTFEHLFDPPLALARTRALLAPGALLFASMPAWNVPHMVPSHQQGLTPCGAYALLRAAGFDVLRVGWFAHAAYSDALARPAGRWESWAAVGAPDPFDAIPAAADAGRANTVWVLARVSARAPPPPPGERPQLGIAAMAAAHEAARGALSVAPWPGRASLRALLELHPAWLDDDVASVALAAAFYERLGDFVGDGGGGARLLVCGRAAAAIARALVPPGAAAVEEWAPPPPPLDGAAPPPPPPDDAGAPAPTGAFVTDLFEATADPLHALRGAVRRLAPGAPLLVACRAADAVDARAPSLGTCTEYGLEQLLARAGLGARLAAWGLWGTWRYTNAALVRGERLSARNYAATVVVRDDLDAAFPGLVAALAAAPTLSDVVCAPAPGACAARPPGAAPPPKADAARGSDAVDAALDRLVGDAMSDGRNSWPNVVYALVIV